MRAGGASVRVRELALKAPRRDDIAAFRNDLDDALRTASVPALPGGATLHVGRISLGRLPRGLSRQALSALLERHLSSVPVSVMRDGAHRLPSDASAVVIPDVVVLTIAALRSGLGHGALHWAIAERLDIAVHTPAEQVLEAAIDHIFRELGPVAVLRLLTASHDVVPLLLDAVNAVSDAVISRWVSARQAGHEVLALEDHATAFPIAVPDEETPGRSYTEPATPAPTVSIPRPLQHLASQATARWGRRSRRRSLVVLWASLGLAGAAPSERRLAQLAKRLDEHGAAPGAPDPVRRPKTVKQTPSAQPSSEPAGASVARGAEVDVPGQPQEHPVDLSLASIQDLAGIPSSHAGLWLLLPALRMVGAEAAGAAIDHPLCQTLFLRFAARLGLRESDPVLPLDPLIAEPASACTARWCPHETVLRALSGEGSLRLQRSTPGQAFLGMRRGPAGLASLSSGDLATVRNSGLALRAVGGRADVSEERLETAFALACQRLISVLTGRGWRHLVTRPGRVLIGPRHVDVTFDLHTADPGIRCAGLDIDPGWVPWLGRVVTYHYAETGHHSASHERFER